VAPSYFSFSRNWDLLRTFYFIAVINKFSWSTRSSRAKTCVRLERDVEAVGALLQINHSRWKFSNNSGNRKQTRAIICLFVCVLSDLWARTLFALTFAIYLLERAVGQATWKKWLIALNGKWFVIVLFLASCLCPLVRNSIKN
jgi:hypothetical protein